MFFIVAPLKCNFSLISLIFWKRFEIFLSYRTEQVSYINLILILKKTFLINNFWFFEFSVPIKQARKTNSWNNILILDLWGQRFLIGTFQAIIHIFIAPRHCILLDFRCCLHIIILFLLDSVILYIECISIVFIA